MTKFIILSGADVWNLFNNKPVKVYIDQIPHVLCTDAYYEGIRDESTNRMDEQKEVNKNDVEF